MYCFSCSDRLAHYLISQRGESRTECSAELCQYSTPTTIVWRLHCLSVFRPKTSTGAKEHLISDNQTTCPSFKVTRSLNVVGISAKAFLSPAQLESLKGMFRIRTKSHPTHNSNRRHSVERIAAIRVFAIAQSTAIHNHNIPTMILVLENAQAKGGVSTRDKRSHLSRFTYLAAVRAERLPTLVDFLSAVDSGIGVNP